MKFEEIDRDDGDYVDYSVSEAKNYYYRFINESPLITKHKTRGNKENSLLEIDISPDWHNTISGYKNGLISINVPIFDGRDALALKPAINGVTNFVHVVQKLIVVKDERTDKEGAYLMTFIPDVSFCPYPMKMDVNSFINSGNKGEFRDG